MKIFFAACALAIPLLGQSAIPPKPASSISFTSPDGTFRIAYPDLLVRCERLRVKNGPGYMYSWSPEGCVAYIPPCSDAEDPDQPLPCLAYPRNEHSATPTFDAAVLSISETSGSEQECLVKRDHPLKPIMIHGVRFQGGSSADAAMNRARNDESYSAFHGGKCYSLNITTVTTAAAMYDEPVKPLTKEDWAEIKGRLKQARDSFEFLKWIVLCDSGLHTLSFRAQRGIPTSRQYRRGRDASTARDFASRTRAQLSMTDVGFEWCWFQKCRCATANEDLRG